MVAKKKVANKLNTTLFDLIDIYKAVKPSHLEKSQIIQNVNKLIETFSQHMLEYTSQRKFNKHSVEIKT